MTIAEHPNTLDNTYQQHLNWLFKQQRFLNPTLERTKMLLAFLDNPQENFDVVLVGGTNGKGSVVVSLAAMLQADGKRTARFISPHLSYFSERFVVDSYSVHDEAILEVINFLRPEAERIGASFFEIVTAMACKLFADAGVDVAVFEVGLGGRFDSTNCLDPVVSIISNVSLDHTKVLGNTVEEIAADKAQIMRFGRPCFSAATGSALDVLKAEADKLGANFTALQNVKHKGKSLGWQGVELDIELDIELATELGTELAIQDTKERSEANMLSVHSPLVGVHQIDNVSLAVLAAKTLGVSDKAIQQGAKAARWAGRLEAINHKGQTFLLDGAHNQASAKALAKAIKDLGLEKPVLIFGISADKTIQNVVDELHDSVGDIVLCKASNSPRAAKEKELLLTWSEFKKQENLTFADSLEDALKIAQEKVTTAKQLNATTEQTIVVAGSLYLIGEIRPLLLAEEQESWERWQ